MYYPNLRGSRYPHMRSISSVVTIEGGVERARVQDQRHERGCGRSSPAIRAVSWWPEAPRPRLRGCGLSRLTFSSSASRISSAIDVPRSAANCRNRLSRCSGVTTVVRRTPSLCQGCHNDPRVAALITLGTPSSKATTPRSASPNWERSLRRLVDQVEQDRVHVVNASVGLVRADDVVEWAELGAEGVLAHRA
jgi:hypothetical protein